nr:unnamed protein product [Spirometra erinaceieuropaei]
MNGLDCNGVIFADDIKLWRAINGEHDERALQEGLNRLSEWSEKWLLKFNLENDEDQDYTCPHCDRTFTSHIGLVDHLRIHRTETGEPLPGAPTYTHRTCLHCPHGPRTFTHRMGICGHMRMHESGIDHNSDTPTTSNAPTVPSPTLAPSPCAPINIAAAAAAAATTTTTDSSVADTDTADFSCPHCPRTFSPRIGLVGHLRIHRTENEEPVPRAPTYAHQARLNCPHCHRTFRHCICLFGHIRIHEDLR